MIDVHHRTTTVNGHEVFYREAGHADAPVVLLLHGFPTSSRMFRNLIPALADRYHVIAPDHLGFGHSATPPADEFDLHLRRTHRHHPGPARPARHRPIHHVRAGLRRAHRLAPRTAPTHQSARPSSARAATPTTKASSPTSGHRSGPTRRPPAPTPKVRSAARSSSTPSAGSTSPGCPSPTWSTPTPGSSTTPGCAAPATTGSSSTSSATTPPTRPSTPPSRSTSARARCPLLAVWGAGDEIFGPDGATAFSRDLPDAEIHLVQGGHFLLESALDTVAGYIRGFLGRTLAGSSPQRSGSKR